MLTPNWAQLSKGRENNFDFLRLLMACVVIFAHSYAFLYNGSPEGNDPLIHFTDGQQGLGGLAVYCFFLMSGFLVTQSWLRTKRPIDYLRKRALRILPGLIAVLAFTAFVIGPIATENLGGYFRDPGTYRYLTFMLHPNLHIYDKLPGVFLNNPLPDRVNGSLWTIRYEIICYGLVAMMGAIGILRRPGLIVLITVGLFGVRAHMWQVGALGASFDSLNLTGFFLVGMLVYLYRDRIPHSRLLACLVVASTIVADKLHFLPIVAPFFIGYLLFFVAFSRSIRLYSFAKRGDLSYGIYLYAFPVQQLLVVYYQSILNPLSLSLSSLAISSMLAVLSWKCVEQPFMKLKSSRDAVVPLPQAISEHSSMPVTVATHDHLTGTSIRETSS